MIIERPRNSFPSKLRGLHLFHFGGAACAQRVRFVLAEKGIRRGPDIPWHSDTPATRFAANRTYVSRVVSLARKEHLTDEYAAIHPNMVVPALVHDGVLHIESVDIIHYIERTWPEPALVPRGREDECAALVERAGMLHRSLRFVQFKWSLGSLGKIGATRRANVRRLEAATSPEQLSPFYEAYEEEKIATSVYVDHLRQLERGFSEVEARLADGRTWLLGESFTLADVVWSAKINRMRECGYPFERMFQKLAAWFGRVVRRPSFREAVWRDIWLGSHVFRIKAGVQNLLGTGIANFVGPLPGAKPGPSEECAQ